MLNQLKSLREQSRERFDCPVSFFFKSNTLQFGFNMYSKYTGTIRITNLLLESTVFLNLGNADMIFFNNQLFFYNARFGRKILHISLFHAVLCLENEELFDTSCLFFNIYFNGKIVTV